MIQAVNLGKQFGDFWAVSNVSLHVGKGEVLALLGPNGAGKTTTVRMLTSILRPTSGHAFVGGFNVVTEAQKVREIVGVLTENHGLYNRMPARDYLDFFSQVYGMEKSARNIRIDYLLQIFDLAAAKKKKIGEFSKGMRQKLALARALIHEPPVLLLDEPTSAMDPESARLVRDAIHVMRSEERSIIICTHNLVEAEELADRIAIIRGGKIVANGTKSDLTLEYLGQPKYRIEFAGSNKKSNLSLPNEVDIISEGENHIVFCSPDPDHYNPIILDLLVNLGVPVKKLEELPQSLEEVYLQVMSKSHLLEQQNA